LRRVKVKICGITSTDDALAACDYGADAIGFIFYEKSPRYIKPEHAIKIIEHLPAFVSIVGVFVDEKIDAIQSIIDILGLHYVQLHGNEPLSMITKLGKKAIKTFRIKDAYSINDVNKSGLNIVLLDSYTNKYGGSGKGFDHKLLKGLSSDIKFILSGGITPDNVREIVNTDKPYAIDVSSGVEISPGRKSKEKIKLLFEKLKANS
jgi:phosphoribosylanthranilate isomerase